MESHMQETGMVYIADVFCPWCFAFAPIMKRIAQENPELPVKVYGGNLISSPMTLQEDAQNSPGLVNFWRQVEQLSGRSLEGAIKAVETGRDVDLYSPGADEILAVLNEEAPGHELEQLFMLEDLFYGQGANLFTEETLAYIAEKWNLNTQKFERALNQPQAARATEANLEKMAQVMGEVTSYPSLFLRHNGRVQVVSRGYVPYETADGRLKSLMRALGLDADSSYNCSTSGSCTLGKK